MPEEKPVGFSTKFDEQLEIYEMRNQIEDITDYHADELNPDPSLELRYEGLKCNLPAGKAGVF